MTTEKPKKKLKLAATFRRVEKEGKAKERQRAITDRLSGRDYLNQVDAAAYCCVSIRQFRKVAKEHGLFGFYFGGRLVYRRVDLVKLMEGAANG